MVSKLPDDTENGAPRPGQPDLPAGRRSCTEDEAIRRGFGGRAPARRRQVLAETLQAFRAADPPDRFHRLARANHGRWARTAAASPETADVQVLAGDWGEVTLGLSRRYGRTFAVLNMANAYIPGGGYVEGAASQEENMYRRSDCPFHIRGQDYDRQADRYRPHMTELISGVTGRVHLDITQPRVCIRGPEDHDAPDLGYRWLAPDEVFMFHELRAAAQDLRHGEVFDPDLARRQIAAQLDTLIEAGIRHAVLGAFGCGAFRNPAEDVAAIYCEEIGQRRTSFAILAFAIRQMPYQASKLLPFQRAFEQFQEAPCAGVCLSGPAPVDS